MGKRSVEVFTSGCYLCDDAVKLVKDTACPNCEVTVYNLADPCESKECIDKAKKYGVNAVPAVVVDGTIVDCCNRGKVSTKALVAAGVGQ
jgi:hypothetical protein